MTYIVAIDGGVDLTLAHVLRGRVRANPTEQVFVLGTQRAGGEHILDELPEVQYSTFGAGGLVSLAQNLTSVLPDTTLCVAGSSKLAKSLFVSLTQPVLRQYRLRSFTSAGLRQELDELPLADIDEFVATTEAQRMMTAQLMPHDLRAKVQVDNAWMGEGPAEGYALRECFFADGEVPLIWSGSLSEVGSGFRDFARLMAHLPSEYRPLCVLSQIADPIEFSDLGSNLGWAGAFHRSTIITAPSLAFLDGLVSLAAARGGLFLSTALLPIPNSLLPIARDRGLPVVGYENALLGEVFPEAPVRHTSQGDIHGLAGLVLAHGEPAF